MTVNNIFMLCYIVFYIVTFNKNCKRMLAAFFSFPFITLYLFFFWELFKLYKYGNPTHEFTIEIKAKDIETSYENVFARVK